MKWTNKGHEFDELGAVFQKNKDILIVSDKCTYEYIKRKVDFLGVNILWYDEKKQFGFLNTVKNIFKKNIFKCKTVIVSNNEVYKKLILKYKLIPQQNIFLECGFTNNYTETNLGVYLSVFAMYVADKVYFPSNSFVCTTKCTLNCKDCLNFAPFDSNKAHCDIERLKSDVDIYFKCVDRVGLLHLTGGEPFMYPHLAELIEYIHENYRDKVDILGTVTNATVMPSKELLQTLKKCDVRVEVDDYRQAVPELKKNHAKLLDLLKEYKINAFIYTGAEWTWRSVFPPREIYDDSQEELLIKKRDTCGSIYQELRDKKIYGCSYCGFIETAGHYKAEKEDYYDLTTFTPENKKELVEFRFKYNKKGYVSFCKYCDGLPPWNKETVEPALQVKGTFGWDINNPTESIKLTIKNDANN